MNKDRGTGVKLGLVRLQWIFTYKEEAILVF